MPSGSDYASLANVFANLLALPNTIAQQNQGQTAIRSALSQALTPEQLNAVAPAPGGQFPGYNTPYVGGAERFVGGIGQNLQRVLGNVPQAPRLPLGTLVAMRNMTATERKQKALEDLGRSFTNPDAAKMLQIDPSAAVRMEKGNMTGSGESAIRFQYYKDQGYTDQQARAAVKADLDKRHEKTGPDEVGKGYLDQAREYDPRRLQAIANGLKVPDMTPAQAKQMLDAQREQKESMTPGPEADLERQAQRLLGKGLIEPDDIFEWKAAKRQASATWAGVAA